MSATTTSFLAAGGSNSYLAAEVLVEMVGIEAAQKSNMPEVMWVKYLDGLSTLTAHYRSEAPLTVSTATEGNALPVVQWSPTGTTVVAGLDGISVQITDLVNSIAPDVMGDAARQGGTALARAIDSSACALFPSLTATSVGTTAALTVSTILAGNAVLDAAHADNVGPYVGRLHPHQFGNLYQDILSKNYGIAKISLDANGKEIINIGETVFRKNSYVPEDGSGVYWNGGMFVYQALGLAIAQQPSVRVLPMPGYATWAIDCTIAFGAGLVRPTLGLTVLSGVTA